MPSPLEKPRIGYVMKRYPRYSETFIVNEILEHERAGLPIEIFALRPVRETHFQDALAAVRAPVTYLSDDNRRSRRLWALITEARARLPGFWKRLDTLVGPEGNAAEPATEDLMQTIDLALHAHERGLTHLHAHFGTLAATVTRGAAHLARIPYSVTLHAKDIYHESVDPTVMRRILSEAAAVVTVSDYNRMHLEATYGDAASGVTRIYNGLDLTRFDLMPTTRAGDAILAVGRLVEKKGFDVLIDACAILRERGVRFRCRIVGDGVDGASLRDRIERLDLGSLVQLEGPRPHANLIGLFREAAVFVAPCIVAADGDRDGLPTVLLEAIALGTPCVSTAVTGIPELVHDGETGLCVPPRDPEALADALERMLADPDLGARLATRARARVEQAFDIRRNAARLRDVFAAATRTWDYAATEVD
jgi:colanic acid/amylovoran biosynthesis glycosyltransferase